MVANHIWILVLEIVVKPSILTILQNMVKYGTRNMMHLNFQHFLGIIMLCIRHPIIQTK